MVTLTNAATLRVGACVVAAVATRHPTTAKGRCHSSCDPPRCTHKSLAVRLLRCFRLPWSRYSMWSNSTHHRYRCPHPKPCTSSRSKSSMAAMHWHLGPNANNRAWSMWMSGTCLLHRCRQQTSCCIGTHRGESHLQQLVSPRTTPRAKP
jgi:hypothetical protein